MEMVLYHLNSLNKALRMVLGLVMMMTAYQILIRYMKNIYSLKMKKKLLLRKTLKKFLEIFHQEENHKEKNFWME